MKRTYHIRQGRRDGEARPAIVSLLALTALIAAPASTSAAPQATIPPATSSTPQSPPAAIQTPPVQPPVVDATPPGPPAGDPPAIPVEDIQQPL